MGLRYNSTILVEGDEPTNRAMLDMLKKVNEVDADLVSLSQTTQTEIADINTEIADLAIISGSNANGKWIKFPDGTMMQTGRASKPAAGGGTLPIDFPIDFSDTTYFVQITARSFGGQNFALYHFNGADTVSGCQFSGAATANDQTVDWTVWGSWE